MQSVFAGFLALTLLTACATPNLPPGQASLKLHQPLVIPADSASVRLQYGRVVAFNAVQEQDPFCIFVINTVSEREQTVQPGTFAVTSITRTVEPVATLPVYPEYQVMRASMGNGSGGGRPSLLYYKTLFRLHDATQPVRALNCMSNQMASGSPFLRHLTPAEIRQALGPLFTLELPI